MWWVVLAGYGLLTLIENTCKIAWGLLRMFAPGIRRGFVRFMDWVDDTWG